jgi:hypothetical protein
LAAASLAAAAGLTGCGTSASQAGQPVPASTSIAPSTGLTAGNVLALEHFTGSRNLDLRDGSASSAYGFKGNTEEIAVVCADAGMGKAGELDWLQSKVAWAGIGDWVTVQADTAYDPWPVVTVTGDRAHMAVFMQQISS